MRPPALPAVVLALCCLLAGCNALAPGATTDDTEVPAVTPAEVPRAGADRIAPGLTGERVTDGAALLAAHRAVLANRTVTVEQFSRATARNGTELYEQRLEYRYTADRSHVNVVGRDLQTGYGSNVDLWANASVGLYRYGGADDPRYRVLEVGVGLDPAERLRYELDLADGATPPIEARSLGEHDGYERFQVTLRPEAGQTDGADTRATTLVVDERGFVSEVHSQRRGTLSYESGYVEAGTVDVVLRYAVGGESVDRPDWVADAREAIANREYVAPGVTTDGVVDTRALVEAHRRTLANTSVTYERERRIERNGTLATLERNSQRFSADGERYYSVNYRVDDGQPSHQEFWTNGTVGYVRSGRGNATSYHATDGEQSERRVPTPDLDRAVEFRDARVTALDDGRYRVVVEDYLDFQYVNGTRTRARSSSLVFVVGERGVVIHVERRATLQADDGEVLRTSENVAFRELGTTTVPSPDWLDAAVNATG